MLSNRLVCVGGQTFLLQVLRLRLKINKFSNSPWTRPRDVHRLHLLWIILVSPWGGSVLLVFIWDKDIASSEWSFLRCILFPASSTGLLFQGPRKYQGGDAKIENTHRRISDGLVMGNTTSAKP